MPKLAYTIQYRRSRLVTPPEVRGGEIVDGTPFVEKGLPFSQRLQLDSDDPEAGAAAWLGAIGDDLELVSIEPAA